MPHQLHQFKDVQPLHYNSPPNVTRKKLYHARYTDTWTRVEHRDAGTDELTSRSGGYLNVVIIHREEDDRQK